MCIYHIPNLSFWVFYFPCHHQFSYKRLQSLFFQFICCAKSPAINFLYFTLPGERACQDLNYIIRAFRHTLYKFRWMMNLWAPGEKTESVLFLAVVLLMLATLHLIYLDLKCSITVNHLLTTLHWIYTEHFAVTAVSHIILQSWWMVSPCICQPEDATCNLYNEISFMSFFLPPCEMSRYRKPHTFPTRFVADFYQPLFIM